MPAYSLAADDFYLEIISLEKALARLKEKFLKLMPVKYGSDTWWDKMDREALAQINNGEYTHVKDKKGLRNFLDDLKQE